MTQMRWNADQSQFLAILVGKIMTVFRKLVTRASAAALLVLGAIGVSPLAASASQNTPSGGSGGNDALIYLHSIEPATFYQWWTQSEYPRRQFLDSLVFLDGEGKLHPWLAKTWEQNGTVWKLTLRDDVVFSDGTPFNAANVVKNFDFWLNISTSVPDSFFKEAKAIDDHTVEIHTTIPQPWLPNLLSSPAFGINSTPSLERPFKEIGERPIGSGPFVLDQWKRGEEIVLVRNDNYKWGPESTHGGPAHLKEVRWKFVPDANARWIALEQGEADLIYDPPSTKWQEANDKHAASRRIAPGRNQTISFNTEFGPFVDKRVRQAFAYASNRQAIVESLFRGAVPFEGNGAYSQTTPDYVDLNDRYPLDREKAVALLEEAGWTTLNGDGYRVDKDGKVLEVTFPYSITTLNPEGATALQALQAEVKKVGFKLDLIALTPTDVAAGRYTGADEYDLHIGYWTWYAPTVLSINFRPAAEGKPNGHNRVRSRDQALQDAIIAAHEETDEKARHDKLVAIQNHISDEALAIGFFASTYTVVGRKDLDGLIHNIFGPIFYELRKN